MCERGNTVVNFLNGVPVAIDGCISPLVDALNAAGFPTVASCCGHGHRPGVISLKDGRELFITADYAAARALDAHYPYDINGERRFPMKATADYWRCRACGCLWRDNQDNTVSLASVKQTSCPECELKPTHDVCDPLMIAGDNYDLGAPQVVEAKTTRCVFCRAEFTDAEVKNASACPSCGTTGVPAAIADDVEVKISWHELRILCMWADNWERGPVKKADPDHRQGVITAIARDLMKSQPRPSAGALTLSGELANLQDKFPSATLLDGAGATLIPGKKVM